MLWLTFLIFLPNWALAFNYNYCSLSHDHTMCKYEGSGPTCGSNKESGVSKTEIQQILKLHNDFREKVALGREGRGFPGPQPQAANMQALVWDDNLAAVAQKWADQCIFQHDTCRRDHRFNVGQNIYFSSGFSKVNWTRAVSAWYEEVTVFNSNTVDGFQFQPEIAHYSQLVWGNTRYIGCGRVTYGGAYRLRGYQKMEYVLSSSSENETPIENINENRRRTDILPDLEENPTIIPKLAGVLEKTTLSSTTNRATEKKSKDETSGEENSTEQIKTEESNTMVQKNEKDYSTSTTYSIGKNYLNKIGGEEMDSGKLKNAEIHPMTMTHTTKVENLKKTTAKKINPVSSKNDETQPNIKKVDHVSSVPTFSIYIPGYWISKSKPDSNGIITGAFHSLDFSGPVDFNNFIQRTSNSNSGAEHSSQIEENRLTPGGWIDNIYDDLGRDQLLVCNYGPTGNYLNQPVYNIGYPCSRCPLKSKCLNGLCVQ